MATALSGHAPVDIHAHAAPWAWHSAYQNSFEVPPFCSPAKTKKAPGEDRRGLESLAITLATTRLTAGYFPVVVLLGPIVSLPAPMESVLVESALLESAAGVLGSFSSDESVPKRLANISDMSLASL
jgi:hypothetical protein